MAATLFPVSGSKIYIGTAPVSPKAKVVEADFAATTWVEIDGWTLAGTIGDAQEIIEQSFINSSRVRKAKGNSNAGSMENAFVPVPSDPGQILVDAAATSCRMYQWKVEWGALCAPSSTVTISSASPGVVTWASHGLLAGQPVVFSTTGGLPAGLTAGTTYYVIASGLTANTFQVSATVGGAAINTTTVGTGTHTAVAMIVGMTRLFQGLAMPSIDQGGEANTAQLVNSSIAIDSNIIKI